MANPDAQCIPMDAIWDANRNAMMRNDQTPAREFFNLRGGFCMIRLEQSTPRNGRGNVGTCLSAARALRILLKAAVADFS